MPVVSDVILGAAPTGLRPPGHAITDGSDAPVLFDAWPLIYSLRRVRVPLPVDAGTA